MTDYNVPGDFDPEDDFTTGQGEHGNLQDLADLMGWATWQDVMLPNAELEDPEHEIRPGIYAYAEDALWDAYEVGIIDFIHIWWDGEYWHLVVDDPSP